MAGHFRNIVATFVQSFIGAAATAYTLTRAAFATPVIVLMSSGTGTGDVVIDVTSFLLSPRTTSVILECLLKIDARATNDIASITVSSASGVNPQRLKAERVQATDDVEYHAVFVVALNALKQFRYNIAWTSGIPATSHAEIRIIGEVIG